MRKEVREALDRVEDVLMRGDQVSADLWHILTALRGPDESSQFKRKGTNTIYIRRAAFPRLSAQIVTSIPAALSTWWPHRPITAIGMKTSHFLCHLFQAERAIKREEEGVGGDSSTAV